MYWSDFKGLIERSAQPNTLLFYQRPSTKNPNQILICDWDLPRRDGAEVMTAWSKHDWYLQTKVCDITWENGEVPIRRYDQDTRGALEALTQLIQQGSVRWSNEVDSFCSTYLEERQRR